MNQHGATPVLIEDGVFGPKTEAGAEARRELDARARQDPSCAAELAAIAGSLPDR